MSNIKELNEKNIKADETSEERFRRIASFRAKKVIYELNRLSRMTSQPNYDILDVDAQKLVESITVAYSQFNDLYTKIASGQSLKANKKEQADIF